jgi:hypothetical protein
MSMEDAMTKPKRKQTVDLGGFPVWLVLAAAVIVILIAVALVLEFTASR